MSHSADDAIVAWGRLGVPEVWRFDAAAFTCSFWNRATMERTSRIDRSLCLPALDAGGCRSSRCAWRSSSGIVGGGIEQLEAWVRDVIRPRLERRRLMNDAAAASPADAFSLADAAEFDDGLTDDAHLSASRPSSSRASGCSGRRGRSSRPCHRWTRLRWSFRAIARSFWSSAA